MDTPHQRLWLDTETKAALQKLPPQKLAPATTQTFSVVVLSRDFQPDHARHVRAFGRVLSTSHIDAEFQTTRQPPFVVTSKLSVEDAILAQFELSCGDIISAFIANTVIANAEPDYLAELYCSLVYGDEWEKVPLRVISIPQDQEGTAFLEQFIGQYAPDLPYEMLAMRKKARVMQYWAQRSGVQLESLGD